MTRLEIGFITEEDYEAEEHEEHAIIRSIGADKYSFLYSIPHSDGGTYIKTAEYNKEQLMVWFRGTMRLAMIALNPYKGFQFNMPIVPDFMIPTDKLAKEDELYSLVDLFSHQLDFMNVEGPAPILQAGAAVAVAAVPVVQEDPSGSSSSSSGQDDPAVPVASVSVASVPVESPSASVSEASVPVESPSVPEASVPVIPSASVSEDSVPVEGPSVQDWLLQLPSPAGTAEARRSLRIKSRRPIVEGDD